MSLQPSDRETSTFFRLRHEYVISHRRAQEALKTGHFVSVLQVLMQLQRVCNHPELVAPREGSSALYWPSLQYDVPSVVLGALRKDHSQVSGRRTSDWGGGKKITGQTVTLHTPVQ